MKHFSTKHDAWFGQHLFIKHTKNLPEFLVISGCDSRFQPWPLRTTSRSASGCKTCTSAQYKYPRALKITRAWHDYVPLPASSFVKIWLPQRGKQLCNQASKFNATKNKCWRPTGRRWVTRVFFRKQPCFSM